MKQCIFCNLSEVSNYHSCPPNSAFICSKCVQILLGIDKNALKSRYNNFKAKGQYEKLWALVSFLQVSNEERRWILKHV